MSKKKKNAAKKAVKRAVKKPKKPAPKKTAKVSFLPKGFTAVTPYLVCRGAADAIAFYKKAFGAKEHTRMLMPDGSIAHAEISIGNAYIVIGEESKDMGMLSPLTIGGSGSGIMVYVPNVDKLFASAIAAGATVEMPLGDQFWGDRYGKLADPFGHKWAVATHIEDLTTKQMTNRGEEFFKQFAQ